MEPDNLEVAIKALENKRDELQVQTQELHRQLSAINATIHSLKKTFGGANTEENRKAKYFYNAVLNTYQEYQEYNEGLSSTRKVLFILNEQKRFMKFREIAKIIFEKERKEYTAGDVALLSAKLTTSSQGLKRAEKIVKYKEIFWGLPEWFDAEKNEIKMGYEPIVDQQSGIITKLFGEYKKP